MCDFWNRSLSQEDLGVCFWNHLDFLVAEHSTCCAGICQEMHGCSASLLKRSLRTLYHPEKIIICPSVIHFKYRFELTSEKRHFAGVAGGMLSQGNVHVTLLRAPEADPGRWWAQGPKMATLTPKFFFYSAVLSKDVKMRAFWMQIAITAFPVLTNSYRPSIVRSLWLQSAILNLSLPGAGSKSLTCFIKGGLSPRGDQLSWRRFGPQPQGSFSCTFQCAQNAHIPVRIKHLSLLGSAFPAQHPGSSPINVSSASTTWRWLGNSRQNANISPSLVSEKWVSPSPTPRLFTFQTHGTQKNSRRRNSQQMVRLTTCLTGVFTQVLNNYECLHGCWLQERWCFHCVRRNKTMTIGHLRPRCSPLAIDNAQAVRAVLVSLRFLSEFGQMWKRSQTTRPQNTRCS